MQRPSKAIAIDVDLASLTSLRKAFPEWEIEATSDATIGRLPRTEKPGSAALLIVGARAEMAETLGLCRRLRNQPGREQTPLLVLVSPAQEVLVRAALEAGANSCLVLPIHAKDLRSMVARALDGNQPGRHTLALDRAQLEDSWQDDGGEG